MADKEDGIQAVVIAKIAKAHSKQTDDDSDRKIP